MASRLEETIRSLCPTSCISQAVKSHPGTGNLGWMTAFCSCGDGGPVLPGTKWGGIFPPKKSCSGAKSSVKPCWPIWEEVFIYFLFHTHLDKVLGVKNL